MGELSDKEIIDLFTDTVKTHFNIANEKFSLDVNRLVKAMEMQAQDICAHERRIVAIEYNIKDLKKELVENSEKTNKLENFINDLKKELVDGLEAIRRIAAKKFPLRYVISVILAILSLPGVTRLLEFVIEVIRVKINNPTV